MFPTWKNIRQVRAKPEVAPGIRFVSAPGHTPGHRAFHLASGSSQLMISNDTAYVPALVVANPGWRGAYDQDGATAEASRRKLLDRVIADKIDDLRLPLPVPGRRHDREGRRRLCAHRHEERESGRVAAIVEMEDRP